MYTHACLRDNIHKKIVKNLNQQKIASQTIFKTSLFANKIQSRSRKKFAREVFNVNLDTNKYRLM